MEHRLIRPMARWSTLVVGLLSSLTAHAAGWELATTQEATIADIQAALKARQITCRQLVQMYLDRIEAYDKRGPALNAIIMVNSNALVTADTLDTRQAQSLCANDSETLTYPGITVEGGERCLSDGEPEEGESRAAADRGQQGECT